MTIYEIVKAHLSTNGFDGLYNNWCDCACKTDSLAPCDGIQPDCKPGYIANFSDGEWGIGPKGWTPESNEP